MSNLKAEDLFFDAVGNAFFNGFVAKIDLVSLSGQSPQEAGKFVGDVRTRLVMTYPTVVQLRDNLNKILEEITKRQQQQIAPENAKLETNTKSKK
jgi:hypothetical protein